jgi:tetratricopeptide (TPR) repeat protein
VGVIVLNRLDPTGGTTVSLNSLAAPKKARDAYAKAKKELAKEKGNPSKAAKELQKAVKIFPEFASAWELLGEARLALGDEAGAREAFLEAARVDPAYTTPYLSLARLELNQGRWEEVIKWSSQVLQRDPQMIKAQYFVAHASFFAGKLAEAEVAARRVQLSTDADYYPGTHYMLGTILAEKGDWASASSEFNRFLEISPDSSVAGPLRRQLKEWERLGLINKSQDSEAP